MNGEHDDIRPGGGPILRHPQQKPFAPARGEDRSGRIMRPTSGDLRDIISDTGLF